MKNLKIGLHRSQISKKPQNMLTEILCRLVVTLFRTGSCGSILKETDLGESQKTTYKCRHLLHLTLTSYANQK